MGVMQMLLKISVCTFVVVAFITALLIWPPPKTAQADPTFFDGFEWEALGDAEFSVDANGLHVSNIGIIGEDGVRQIVPEESEMGSSRGRTSCATPAEKTPKPAAEKKAAVEKKPRAPKKQQARDPRLPAAGTKIERVFKKKTYVITVLERGFSWDGKEWRSSTALAKEITGAKAISGPRFLGFDAPSPKDAEK